MKRFWKDYSYSIVIMFVNQFAIAIFGLVLSLASQMAKNDTLLLVTSIGAIVFYLFLLYFKAWELGAKDKVAVDFNKKPYRPLNGLLISLCANTPNLILALLFTIGYPFMQTQAWAGNLCAVTKVIMLLFEGMYTGVLSYFSIGEFPLNTFWWSYFLIVAPALLTVSFAYLMGLHNRKFTKLFDYKAPKN